MSKIRLNVDIISRFPVLGGIWSETFDYQPISPALGKWYITYRGSEKVGFGSIGEKVEIVKTPMFHFVLDGFEFGVDEFSILLGIFEAS